MSTDLTMPASSRKDPTRMILKGSVVLVGGMVVAQLCGYGYRLLVAHLGPADYGHFSLGLAVIGVATTFISFGLAGGVARYVPFFHGRQEYGKLRGVILVAFGVVAVSSLVMTGGLLAFSRPISNFLTGGAEFRKVLLVIALATPFLATRPIFMKSLVTLHRVELRVLSRDLLENVLKLGLTGLLFLFGYGLLGAIWSYVIALACSWALSLYFLERRVVPIFSSSVAPVFQVGELLTFSMPLFLTTLLAPLQSWIDTFFISYFRTMPEVGLYNVGLLLASLLSLVPNLVLPVAYPHIINHYGRGEMEDARVLARKVSRWILLTVTPVTLWIILMRQQLLPLLFGSSYTASSWVVYFLALGYLAVSLSLPCRRILSMVKRTDLIFRVTIVSVVINVVGNLMLVPRYGMLGAALATSVAMVANYLLLQWAAWKSYPIDLVDKRTLSLLGALVVACLALIGSKMLVGESLLGLFVGTSTYGAAYVASLILLGALESSDWEVLHLVRGRIRRGFSA